MPPLGTYLMRGRSSAIPASCLPQILTLHLKQPFYITLLEFAWNCSFQASEERTPTALQPLFWVLLALSFLPCVSKAASFAPKIPPKPLAEGCLAVFVPPPFVKASKTPQTILCVLSRGFVQHWRKAGHENLLESVFPKPCLADEICKEVKSYVARVRAG